MSSQFVSRKRRRSNDPGDEHAGQVTERDSIAPTKFQPHPKAPDAAHAHDTIAGDLCNEAVASLPQDGRERLRPADGDGSLGDKASPLEAPNMTDFSDEKRLKYKMLWTLSLHYDSPLTDKQQQLRGTVEKSNKNSGKWLLASEEYTSWLASRHSFLWLHGISGCGKSMLCSTVIKSLVESAVQNSKMIVAYWYFDNTDPSTQNFDNLVRLILHRIAIQATPFPEPMVDLIDRYRGAGFKPTTALIQTLKKTVAALEEDVFLVLDAIDEYQTGNETIRQELLDFLVELGDAKLAKLHILVTSVPEPDIENAFRRLSSPPADMDVEKSVLVDVAAYLDTTIVRYAMDKHWGFDTKAKIGEALKDDGRFRIVSLQLEDLRKCSDDRDIDATLSSIPQSLDDAYLRSLRGVPPRDVRRLRHIFFWVSVAARRLTSLELAAAPGVDLHNPADLLKLAPSSMIRLEKQKPPGEHQSDLLQQTIASSSSTDTDVVNFDHPSVKRFLCSPKLQQSDDDRLSQFFVSEKTVHVELTKLMVDHLLAINQPSISPSNIATTPFMSYAARYWHDHMKKGGSLAEEDEVLYSKLLILFGNPMSPAYFNWIRTWDPERKKRSISLTRVITPRRYQGSYINGDGDAVRTTLRLASLRGDIAISQKLIAAVEDLEKTMDYEHAPLYIAVKNGNSKLVQVLLAAGAKPDRRPELQGSALHLASFRGLTDIARLLVASGADVNLQSGSFGTALQAAAAAGHTDIVAILLDNGAKPAAVGGLLGTAIQAAETGGHSEAVKLIASRGVAWDDKGDSVWREAYDLWSSQTSMGGFAESLLHHGPSLGCQTQEMLAGVLRTLKCSLPTASDVTQFHAVPLSKPANSPRSEMKKSLFLRLTVDRKWEVEHTERLTLARAVQTTGQIGTEGKYYVYKALFWAILLSSRAKALALSGSDVAYGDLTLEMDEKMNSFGVTMLQLVSSQKEIEYGTSSDDFLVARKELVKCYTSAFEVASRCIQRRLKRESQGVEGDYLDEFHTQYGRFESVMRIARLQNSSVANTAGKMDHNVLNKLRQEIREGFQIHEEETQKELAGLENRIVESVRNMLPGIIREELRKLLAEQREDANM